MDTNCPDKNSDMLNLVQQKWNIAEIKVMVLQIAYALLEDTVYTRDDTVKELLEVVRMLEVQEKVFESEVTYTWKLPRK